MFNRKSLFVALTVVMMLAMLVPVSFAAPEWTHGISIVSPTSDDGAAWVKYAGQGTQFPIKYTIASVGDSVADVHVWFYLVDANEIQKDVNDVVLDAPVAADQEFKFTLKAGIPDGWYGLKLCAKDVQEAGGDPAPELFCTPVMANSVVLDSKAPFNVAIIEPVAKENVTGQHDIIATAEDAFPGHVEKVVVYYQLGDNSDTWIKLGEALPNGVVNHYSLLWDTTMVPDGKYNLKVVATDEVGWETPSAVISVVVDNGFTINLVPGWNLISTPIMLYDGGLASVLSHLHDAAGNPTWATIHTMANEGGNYVWSSADSASGQGDLDTMVDGKGYWLFMKADQDLWLRGTWAQVGPVAPPQYAVSKGWNLIGFTNWGKPPAFQMTRKNYLNNAVNDLVQVMYKYNANTGLFSSVGASDNLTAGEGYWLALSDDGTIYP